MMVTKPRLFTSPLRPTVKEDRDQGPGGGVYVVASDFRPRCETSSMMPPEVVLRLLTNPGVSKALNMGASQKMGALP